MYIDLSFTFYVDIKTQGNGTNHKYSTPNRQFTKAKGHFRLKQLDVDV